MTAGDIPGCARIVQEGQAITHRLNDAGRAIPGEHLCVLQA